MGQIGDLAIRGFPQNFHYKEIYLGHHESRYQIFSVVYIKWMRSVYLSRRLHDKILGEKNKLLYFRKYESHLTQILHINSNYPCEALIICIFPNVASFR